MAPKLILGLFLATIASLTNAQSANPKLGVNPNAKGATADVTPGSGPNGEESWFNTDISTTGWNPPFLNFSSLVHITLEQFYAGAGSPCKTYDSNFKIAGNKSDIDPSYLAFIAMQESSCQASAGGPTPGLMQVDCSNYPNGICTSSIQDNVNAGANYLKQQLDDNENNALLAFGNYNGWFTANNGLNGNKGLTQGYPCSSEGKSNGDPQNLDYLQQTLNGWFTGQDVYGDESWIGTYQCTGQCGSSLC